VSKTTSELIAPAAPPEVRLEKRAKIWKRLLTWAVVVVACLWLADTGISLLIRHTTLKQRLTARLEAAFGRPVEVGNYYFSLWTGPELDAYPVRVGEDPRFGYEYFLRADSITVRVSFWNLLRGHLELGTVSLSHPSLNLVRNADGDWNLAEWLPRPENAGGASAGADPAGRDAHVLPRFRRIEVEEGRINFKRGDEKLPFAFVDVNGTAETEGTGRWRLDFVAAPERAAVVVQDPGLLHLVGHLGGTSSRLRPALLQIDWSEASIPDVLRLAAGSDYGVRGTMGARVIAQTQGESWTLTGHALFSELHRWDLPLRADNPSVTVIAGGQLDPSGSRVELTNAKIEMAHSSVSATGALDWTRPGAAFADLFLPQPAAAPSNAPRAAQKKSKAAADAGAELRIVSNGISMADLLDWARAFHPGIANDLAMAGYAKLDATVAGWPPRLLDASFDLDRGGMIGTGMPSVRVASVAIRYDARKGITFAPATVTIGAPANSFRVKGSAKPGGETFALHVAGGVANVRGVIETAGKLGWNAARGWTIAGPAHCDLRWGESRLAGEGSLSGSVQWGTRTEGVSLGAPFLNRHIEAVHARVDMQPGVTQIALTAARAFGTRWSGTLEHELSDGWKFSIEGNSLSADELDRWLDPRWRENFLDRMLPFLNSAPVAGPDLDSMRASGKISLGEFALEPVTVHRLQGDLMIDGRRIELTNASGQLARGQVAGSLQANFSATPRYETSVNFTGIDLQALSADFLSLAGGFTGTASAEIRFTMHGVSRSDLLNSLECRGTAAAKELSVANIGLGGAAGGAGLTTIDDPGATLFPEASASFSCAKGKFELRDLALSGAGARWNGAGSVDFARNLDLRLRSVSPNGPSNPAESRSAKLASRDQEQLRRSAQGTEYRVTGTLAAPRILRVALTPRAGADHP
jgi:hypothetical protein